MRQAAQPSSARPRGRRIIERPRLIKLLDDTSARTILLIAPAGYGKTTLARQWAERQPGVHWYTARTGSADVAQLAVDLAAVLDYRPPKLFEFVSQLVRAHASPARQIREITAGFASAAGDVTSACLVIDDYQILGEASAAERLVRELQSQLGFRLVIASRTRPKWASARLEVYGETAELGPEELALTDSEARDVLGASGRADGFLAQARGWPAVVGLAAQARASASPPDAGATTLFRFFAEELFQTTPAEIQDQLITLALLPVLSRDVLQTALANDAERAVESAINSGLVTNGLDGPEVHPLVREYLFTKLRDLDDTSQRVRVALRACLARRDWDHAFALIERFDALELLDELLSRSFKPLLSVGRVATLQRISQFAHSRDADASPLVALVDAELAFRASSFSEAEAIATRAARRLGSRHSLASHAWWIAGQAAQLSFNDRRAAAHFTEAQRTAQDDEAETDALWGLTMTRVQAEDSSLDDVLTQFVRRRKKSVTDLVRGTQAELLARRVSDLREPVDVADAVHAVNTLTDPRISTSFMNTYAYHLILSGRYEEALSTAFGMSRVSDEYQLKWAQPHAHWALAASTLGLRRFRKAEGWLRRVEVAADELRYGQLLLNAACLRARLLMALQRPREAVRALAVDETQAASRAMQGEFLAMKALALTVAGAPEEVHTALAARATTLTKSVEARAYAACSTAVAALSAGTGADVVKAFGDAQHLGLWDSIIATLRAAPGLLTALAEMRAVDIHLERALRASGDYDLARRSGIDLGRRVRTPAATTALSPREGEVLELVKQGLTNREIARTLFLSEATVKVHVHHILEKTGARSRTEAATSSELDV